MKLLFLFNFYHLNYVINLHWSTSVGEQKSWWNVKFGKSWKFLRSYIENKIFSEENILVTQESGNKSYDNEFLYHRTFFKPKHLLGFKEKCEKFKKI